MQQFIPTKNRNASWQPRDPKVIERPAGRIQVGLGQKFNYEKAKACGLGSPDEWVHDRKSSQWTGGLGQAGLGSLIDLIQNSMDNPVWNMDVIEQVRWGMQGPQTPASIRQNFGSKIDLFGGGTAVPGIDFVETTMAQTGQTQTYFVACYIGFHVETEPMQWDTIGNGWTVPETTAATVPGSPDVVTSADAMALGFAEGGAFAGQAFVPAVMQHGWWANHAAWHLVRGYNLRWKIGQHTNIMDEVLRHTAYMPPNAQDGSASDSEVDVVDFVNQMNLRYASLGSSLIFLVANYLRLGSVSTAGVAPFPGAFLPTRDFDRVGATYGGMDLRSMLKGNSEFRKLTLPYVLKPGVPIGLLLQENDNDQGNQMRRDMDITQGQGGVIPPLETEYDEIANTATSFLPERSLDGIYPTSGQNLMNVRTIFKSGNYKLAMLIKGFEVTEDWYTLMSTSADIREVVMAACGIRFATQGAT